MSSESSRMGELAAIISKNTAIVEQHLHDNGIPSPTFSIDQAKLDSALPPPIESALLAVREASLELHELTMGPRTFMQSLILRDSRSFLSLIYRFRIAQHIPLDSPTGISYSALSSAVNVSQSVLQHILRFAIANRLFTEPSPGHISHNANSRAIVTEPHLFDWIGVASEDLMPSVAQIATTLQQFPAADEPDQAAGSIPNPADPSLRLAFYPRLALEPSRIMRFANAMKFHNQSQRYGTHLLLESFDWAALKEGATVVDVGGSHGEAARTLVGRFPTLRVVVQDLPDTISGAPSPPDGARIEFVAHDFFAPQPELAAEVYLFRCCLHNWPDKYCVRMLKALVPAMVKGARVLVVDIVLPTFGSAGASVERGLRVLDMVMIGANNAREREMEEVKELFRQADPRFKWVGCITPVASDLSTMEVVWDP